MVRHAAGVLNADGYKVIARHFPAAHYEGPRDAGNLDRMYQGEADVKRACCWLAASPHRTGFQRFHAA